ncbi:MAG TPA: PQQ-binding-like beta-propeller repeat protein [Vicinamibacterales bacterium]|nr:PQQ-binding-like beta-propeller repeat protein [Vicinamibacterales bacterium]
MSIRAATRCCGLVLGVSLSLPLAAQPTPVQGQPVPAPAPATPSAPEKPLYAEAWKRNIDSTGRLRLTFGAAVVVTTGTATPVQAWRMNDGELAWTIEDARDAVGAAAGDGMIFVVAAGRLLALDDSTGRIHWEVKIAPDGAGPAWTTGGGVIVPDGDSIRALRITDGGQVWAQDVGAAASAPPFVAGNRVIVPLKSSAVVALDLATGGELWRAPTGTVPGPIKASAGRLFLVTANGTICAFRETDGRSGWDYPTHMPAIGSVEVDANHVYAALIDNTIRAYDARSGNDRWRTPLDARPVDGPTLLANRLVVGLTSGEILTLDPANGKGKQVVNPAITGAAALAGTRLESVVSDPTATNVFALTWANDRSYTLIKMTATKTPQTARDLAPRRSPARSGGTASGMTTRPSG